MQFSAQFRCSAGCGERYQLDQIVYRCRRCGELLEVDHDRAALKARSSEEWKQLFRTRRASFQESSGVWSKRELVLPALRAENMVSLGEGYSALQASAGLTQQLGIARIAIKQCGVSHSGSFKDLGMTVLVSMVKQMIADGAKIPAIVCASTGDTSAALAAYAAAAGIRAVVLLPKGKISTAQLVQPIANGALVLALDTDFDGCMKIVQELSANDGVYLANSMNSLRLEGQKTVAIEIAEQLDWDVPDWVVIPGGNLGNVSALGAGFDLLIELGLITKRPRICVAQAANAAPLYNSYKQGWADLVPVAAQKTLASAIQIGNPVSFRKAVSVLQRYDGVVEIASEDELAHAAAQADRHGMFTCPHTAVALAATSKLIAQKQIRPTDSVVVVSTANGLKFVDFKVGYHEASLAAVSSRLRNTPIELPAEYGQVRDALLRSLSPT